ncbi:MAG: hypothetical protein WCK39_03450 [Methanomassiliicoccales archaeon]
MEASGALFIILLCVNVIELAQDAAGSIWFILLLLLFSILLSIAKIT